MSGDGVSLQTNLVQLGNVAQSTGKSTQAPHGATPANEPADRRETAKLRRVNEADKTERPLVDPDRRRERDHRQGRPEEPPARAEPEPGAEEATSAADAAHEAGVGGLIDRKA